jgi:hypothetical protein
VKYVYTVFLVILVCHSTAGDDGSWSKDFSTESGSIYSAEENTDIALEKELLVFTGRETFAFFQFKNLSDKDLVVDAGFPIKHNIRSFMSGKARAISSSPYGPSDMPLVEYFETQKVELGDDEPSYQLEDEVLIIPENNGREFVRSSSVDSDVSFSITQDGNEIPMEQVLIERVANQDELSLTFHYKHQLNFGAGQTSLVIVRYSYDLHFGSNGAGFGEAYRWDYVIGTGSTWSGPIEDFYMIVPGEWYVEDIEKDLNLVFQSDYMTVYGKKRYEPALDDVFTFTVGRDGVMQFREQHYNMVEKNFASPIEIPVPTRPASAIIGSISSSSELKDRISVFTKDGIIKRAGFTSLSAVDGYPETSWAEGDAGDGVGEYLEIELTNNVWGMVLQSGFTRVSYPDSVYNTGEFERDYRDDTRGIKDYFRFNNRPYSLLIQDMEGTNLYTLPVEDLRRPQVFPGIHLPKGRYRFVIDGVYGGSKWDDACIGELHFFAQWDLYDGDTLLNDPFFSKALSIWYTSDRTDEW